MCATLHDQNTSASCLRACVRVGMLALRAIKVVCPVSRCVIGDPWFVEEEEEADGKQSSKQLPCAWAAHTARCGCPVPLIGHFWMRSAAAPARAPQLHTPACLHARPPFRKGRRQLAGARRAGGGHAPSGVHACGPQGAGRGARAPREWRELFAPAAPSALLHQRRPGPQPAYPRRPFAARPAAGRKIRRLLYIQHAQGVGRLSLACCCSGVWFGRQGSLMIWAPLESCVGAGVNHLWSSTFKRA